MQGSRKASRLCESQHTTTTPPMPHASSAYTASPKRKAKVRRAPTTPPKSRKRKRPYAASGAPPPTLKIYKTGLKQDDKRRSLLDFAPELRNLIYEWVVADACLVIPRGTTYKSYGCTSAMPRVNKQIRDEFLSIAYPKADIRTTSLDFDFRQIASFLNRMSDKNLQDLPTVAAPKSRRFVIDTYPYGDHPWGEVEYLESWLNRAGNPKKKGSDIDCIYRFAESDKLEKNVEHKRESWFYREAGLPEGRKKRELGKIREAMVPSA